MDIKYFMGEIDLPNGSIWKYLIEAKDIIDAHDIIERRIKSKQLEYDKITNIREIGIFAPYRPVGSFLVRYATAQEILEDNLKDFAGRWDAYSIPGFAEEIINIVLETIPRKAFEEELQRREEKGEIY